MTEVKLLAVTPNPLYVIEYAGRKCHGGEELTGKTGERDAFIRARIQEGHESVIEHASATFDIEGISRAFTHQLVRHRIASYSQRSMRFVKVEDDERWHVNTELLSDRSLARYKANKALEFAMETYKMLLDFGMSKEDARMVLPIGTLTGIVVTMNFRELRHFFKLRLSKEAQWEIRFVATLMLKLIRPHAPVVFEDFE